jgi:hypothetical protein
MNLAAAGLALRRSPLRGAWALFILGSAAALDLLGDGLPWILTANVIFLGLLPFAPRRKALLRNLLIADAIIALCTAPFYVLMAIYQDKGFVDSVMWIPPLNLSRFWYNIGSVYLMHVADSVTFRFMAVPTPEALINVIDAGLLFAVGLAAWRLRRRPTVLTVLTLSFLCLPVMATIISLWRPILLPRYILWSAAPFAILAGIGASTLLEGWRPRWRVAAIGLAAALLLTNLIPYYQVETKPRWDIAAQMLAQDVQPGDVIYLYDTGALPVLRLYLPPGTQTVVLQDSDGDINHAQQAQAAGKRIWAVYGHAGQSGEVKPLYKFNVRTTRALGTPAEVQVAGNRIIITLFNPSTHQTAFACTGGTTLHPAGCS